ncbi:amidase [Candidatus Marithrix sp. Canyon 246]|uniref:amidase n=1 Tax=Candidatus Marithrix sp. Canyon 246 TaxID=1827136 RepID=UPI0014960DDC|nr:amidase family protein [Candidatus Marithrix sp. Canyon 246]
MKTFPEYEQYDALALAELVKKGEVSPKELLAEANERLSKINHKYNAVIYQDNSFAETLINNLDKNSLFCGVPFLVKDLMLAFKGMPMSNGSNAMKSYVPNENNRMADQLNSAGLITFGKTTTSEIGNSPITKTTAFGATLNPWDISKNSGGSSGGSSVVVASRVVPMAYSSDGGGSIRLPASYCGIFGFKPSQGLNKYEDMTKAWAGAVVSHVSTISVRDSAAYLDMVAGNLGNDYSILNPKENSYLFSATCEEKKLKIGLITESPIKTKVHAECIKGAELAAKYCEDLGHDVEATQWNFDGRELMRAFIIIVIHYTHGNIIDMATLFGVKENELDIELNTKFMSIAGSGISQDKVNQALKIWKTTSQKMSILHQKYDVILTPTVATLPLTSNALEFNVFEKLLLKFLIVTGLGKNAIYKNTLEILIDKLLYHMPFTPIANITGQPAMSVPLYWDQNGLPHGAHFMAAVGNDKVLFMLAKQLESEHSWQNKIPSHVGSVKQVLLK